MELYIFDRTRKLAGIVEAFEYLRWTRRYFRCGSFELKAIATDENLALLQIGNLLWKNDDEEAGIIETIELTMQEQEYILVSGRFATSLLARRIIWGTETLMGDLASGIGQLLNNHLINPADSNRKISGIAYSAIALEKPISTQISFKGLMDAVCDLCEAADVGIKTIFDPATGVFSIVLYMGAETHTIFSKEYENLLEQVFTQSVSDYANTALVGGEGEGSDRIFATTGDGAGEDRYEIFVDAKDLRSEDFPDNYVATLQFRGDGKLAELAMVQAFDAEVNQYGNVVYKVDFNVGSRVQVVSHKWGVSMAARITEIEESYDRNGMSLSATFGKPLLTLAQKLKGGIF